MKDAPEEWLFYLLFQTVRRRDLAFNTLLGPLGLDLGKWRVLSVVNRLEACTMNELAEFTTTDRTTLTRTVDQLAAAGLVERHGAPQDRRRVCLVLTSEGRAVFGQALGSLRSFNEQALKGVSQAELDGLQDVVERIVMNIAGTPERGRAVVDFARPEECEAG